LEKEVVILSLVIANLMPIKKPSEGRRFSYEFDFVAEKMEYSCANSHMMCRIWS
jgi:hypothetical protein